MQFPTSPTKHIIAKPTTKNKAKMGYKCAIFLVFLALALVIGFSEGFDFHEKDLESEESLWDLYERWRSHHTVSRSLDDKHKRFNVFKENVKHVHKVNSMDKPYKLKLNKFADLTNHEFRTLFAGSKISHHRMLHGKKTNESRSFMYQHARVPSSIDWRKKGAVTPVKDQGQCGEYHSLIDSLIAITYS